MQWRFAFIVLLNTTVSSAQKKGVATYKHSQQSNYAICGV